MSRQILAGTEARRAFAVTLQQPSGGGRDGWVVVEHNRQRRGRGLEFAQDGRGLAFGQSAPQRELRVDLHRGGDAVHRQGEALPRASQARREVLVCGAGTNAQWYPQSIGNGALVERKLQPGQTVRLGGAACFEQLQARRAGTYQPLFEERLERTPRAMLEARAQVVECGLTEPLLAPEGTNARHEAAAAQFLAQHEKQ